MSWYFLALVAAFSLGFYTILEKEGLKKTSPLAFLLVSWFLMALFSLPIALTRNIFVLDTPDMFLLFLKSLFAAVFFFLIGKALQKMDVSEFSPFLSFSPIIVLVFSYIFLGERIGSSGLLGIGLIVAGAYIVELRDGLLSPFRALVENKNIHLIIFGLFFGGLCAIIDRAILSKGPDLLSFFALNNFLIFFFFLLFSSFKREVFHSIRLDFKKIAPWVLAGSAFFLLADLAYFKALMAPAALVALVIPLKRASLLVSTFVGGEIFKEKNVLKKTLATVIMLLGVFLIVG